MTSIGRAPEEKKVALGPFSFIYDTVNNRLQIQIANKDTLQNDSLWQIDEDGNVSITGTLTQSATLTNVGRG